MPLKNFCTEKKDPDMFARSLVFTPIWQICGNSKVKFFIQIYLKRWDTKIKCASREVFFGHKLQFVSEQKRICVLVCTNVVVDNTYILEKSPWAWQWRSFSYLFPNSFLKILGEKVQLLQFVADIKWKKWIYMSTQDKHILLFETNEVSANSSYEIRFQGRMIFFCFELWTCNGDFFLLLM